MVPDSAPNINCSSNGNVSDHFSSASFFVFVRTENNAKSETICITQFDTMHKPFPKQIYQLNSSIQTVNSIFKIHVSSGFSTFYSPISLFHCRHPIYVRLHETRKHVTGDFQIKYGVFINKSCTF